MRERERGYGHILVARWKLESDEGAAKIQS
jgi:hypothetical protein